MSEIRPSFSTNPSLEQLQKQAKDRLRALRGEGDSRSTLADVQFALAREHGFETWAKLKHHIATVRPPGIGPFEQLANDLAAAYTSGDEPAVRAINANFGTEFPFDFHDAEKVRRRLPTWYASEERSPELAVADARQMVAHVYGFASWLDFAGSITKPDSDARSAPVFTSTRPPFYVIDWQENRMSVSGPQSRADWERVFAIAKEYGITSLEAGGITDEAMRHLAGVQCMTNLNVGGSKSLTDEGVRHLARMPQLVALELGGRHTPLTEHAFEPLRELPQLKKFKSCWSQGFTDAAAVHLGSCERLESVNVMGSAAGDGLIRALEGKRELRYLETGRGVTDAGIPELHRIPVFKTWSGGAVVAGLMGATQAPNRLLIDGAFTDAGLKSLAGLQGVSSLSFFWHSKAFTADGLEPLRRLPHLEIFGIDGDQCTDDAMRQIAAIPRLRQLQAQGAVAGDAGWEALGRSPMLEYIWGRECPNFSDRGFLALGGLTQLRGMGISCKFVSDAALAHLPRFPALRQLVSIDIPDAGFCHIGQCENLDALYCMYCRDTGDEATAQIGKLPKLETYYAGATQITDRSLEILGRMNPLQSLEFWQCLRITDAGVAQLAVLPQLKKIEIGGSPQVSSNVRHVFPESVRVRYSG